MKNIYVIQKLKLDFLKRFITNAVPSAPSPLTIYG